MAASPSNTKDNLYVYTWLHMNLKVFMDSFAFQCAFT